MDGIDITGLNHFELLAALCNGTKPQGMGMYAPKANDTITARDVYDYVNEDESDLDVLGFDYLFGRPLKVSITFNDGKLFLNRWWLYDRDAGEGSAKSVVDALRSSALQGHGTKGSAA